MMNQILAKLIKRIKKRVNLDQFLNSKYARKSKNFIDTQRILSILSVFLFDLFYATIRCGCKMRNDRQWINAIKFQNW